ncbi:conserved hypothetical protein [Anaeromyxobacter dehalogenans 2CP-1]|uniref:Uncharacterized protein n=1 Tax=Anaeromyxobacter dehalogenans (strain ATCC BAA-258 / DSM 21875 / 2CP-1) TaxID=455488 RepID=B8JHG6_ANAD2|nr:hypothetical protein [Anaeromyxobacter dehalogenans]ACL66678.1 conserved hypothetical protein [Anaeromyxobacter dehalogenans 2CP-1]
MVDHVTRITVEAGSPRAAALGGALAQLGFTVHAGRRGLVAESSEVEAQDAKRRLRALGFADREYRVSLEYVRRWGIL